MRTNLHHLISGAAHTRPDALALTHKDTSVSYRELWVETCSVAEGLRRIGLGRGERVAIFLEKRIETVTSIFGTSASGGTFVPINPLLKPPQVAFILRDCQVKILITSEERLSLLADELSACPSVEDVVVVGHAASNAADISAPGLRIHRWATAFIHDPSAAPHDGIDIDIAAIMYTSGSTGSPKGIVLTHRNLIVGAESVSSYLENTSEDVILAALPLSFDAGFSQLSTAFSVGAHVILMNYLLPRDVVRLCAKHGVTGLTCVPPLWIQIAAQEWPAEAGDRIRYFANTGGRMPRTTLDRLRKHFRQARPFLMYGLTEAFRSTYLNPSEVDRRPDSIGKAIPNAEILVVSDDGRLCGPGEEGELVHRGALVAMGYWGDPQRTAETFRPAPGSVDEWRTPDRAVWSGDKVVTDAEGFLYFVGRKDDMIKTSGYRVSPTEVEEAAFGTGLVRDAVALGVPDARLGQRVVLFASPGDTESFDQEKLLSMMRRAVPLYMIPSEVHVLESLPRSPNGKFDRNRLRQDLMS